MTDKKFSFDRESDSVVATRDFDHGVINAKKGDALSAEQLADLSDDSVRHLVEIAEVAKIVKGKAAPAANNGGATA